MSIKRILKKAANLVVEIPDSPEEAEFAMPTPTPAVSKSVEQIIREEPGPDLDQIKIEPEPTPVETGPSAPAGNVEFQSVYTKAGLTPMAFGAEQALEVIRSLPSELPLAARRATVHATLQAMGKAMGVDTKGIVADAGRKVAALSAYEDLLTHQAETYMLSIEQKILELEAKIEVHRADIESTKQMLAAAIAKCDAESENLDEVLEFFTSDQAPSSNAQA